MDVDQADGDGAGAPVIKVIGVGGGGTRIVQFMRERGLTGVQLVVVDTNAQDLERVTVPEKVQIGAKTTGGVGTFFSHEKGLKAVEESRTQLKYIVSGADLVIVVAGLGGGTSSGASLAIAQIARELGITTVALVTLPFAFEGKKHALVAQWFLCELAPHVDALIAYDNNACLSPRYGSISINKAFEQVNARLFHTMQGIIASWQQHAFSFERQLALVTRGGKVLVSWGQAQGENAVADAVAQALNSPWRAALGGSRAARLQAYALFEHSVEDQAELTLPEIHKFIGPDTNCLCSCSCCDSRFLAQGCALLALFVQIESFEAAKKFENRSQLRGLGLLSLTEPT